MFDRLMALAKVLNTAQTTNRRAWKWAQESRRCTAKMSTVLVMHWNDRESSVRA